MIDLFVEENRFLSNFFIAQTTFEGMIFPSSEHAFQAAKTVDRITRIRFQNPKLPAIAAKRLGKLLAIRSDWDEVKQNVMLTVVRSKFSRPELGDRLLTTGNEMLVEGNIWHDVVWGNCVCNTTEDPKFGKKPGCLEPGRNLLGKILMRVRTELLAQTSSSSDQICGERTEKALR
jgi:ribA/ribD-fused uncharacterized protein